MRRIETLLRSTSLMYKELLKTTPSSINFVLHDINIKQILTSNPQQQILYKFPTFSTNIDSIMTIKKPNDIVLTVESKIDYFYYFIKQLNEWMEWFDKFIDIIYPIIEWLRDYHVDGVNQLILDLHNKNDKSTSLIQVKQMVEKTLKLLKSFSDLRRLCYLFNCLTKFQIINNGTINNQQQIQDYIKEL
ncbi:unnamed protein product, partial [Didymodactylos carnosus]